jgi:hypothetical protein
MASLGTMSPAEVLKREEELLKEMYPNSWFSRARSVLTVPWIIVVFLLASIMVFLAAYLNEAGKLFHADRPTVFQYEKASQGPLFEEEIASASHTEASVAQENDVSTKPKRPERISYKKALSLCAQARKSGAETTSNPFGEDGWGHYTVCPGDTLWGIAGSHYSFKSILWRAIAQQNMIKEGEERLLRIGLVLVIPPLAVAEKMADRDFLLAKAEVSDIGDQTLPMTQFASGENLKTDEVPSSTYNPPHNEGGKSVANEFSEIVSELETAHRQEGIQNMFFEGGIVALARLCTDDWMQGKSIRQGCEDNDDKFLVVGDGYRYHSDTSHGTSFHIPAGVEDPQPTNEKVKKLIRSDVLSETSPRVAFQENKAHPPWG